MTMPSATQANNAIGAFFLSVFGFVWLAAWCLNTPGTGKAELGFIAFVLLVLAAFAVRLYRGNAAAYAVYRQSPEGKRSSMVLGLVNAAQWILIFLFAAVLPKAHTHWFVPGVIFIVGLHFVPLAFALRYRPYLVAAGALVALAALGPWLAAVSPASPLAALGTGIILWLTALHQLVVKPAP